MICRMRWGNYLLVVWGSSWLGWLEDMLIRIGYCWVLNMGLRRRWYKINSLLWHQRGSPIKNNPRWLRFLQYTLEWLTYKQDTIMGSMCHYSKKVKNNWYKGGSDIERVRSLWGGYGVCSSWWWKVESLKDDCWL